MAPSHAQGMLCACDRGAHDEADNQSLATIAHPDRTALTRYRTRSFMENRPVAYTVILRVWPLIVMWIAATSSTQGQPTGLGGNDKNGFPGRR